MKKLYSALSDIQKRLAEHRTRQFISDRFLTDVVNRTLEIREDTTRTQDKLTTLLSTYQTDLDNIRFELARVPIEFTVTQVIYRYTYYGTPQYQVGIQRGYFKYLPDANDRPDYVPSLKEKKVGDRVWCLCSKQQANQLGAPEIPTWSETDSIVDWITKSVTPTEREKAPIIQLPGKEPYIEKSRTIQTDTTPTPPPIQTETDLTPTQRIYRYIRDTQPVTTAEILQQQFAGRSRTFAILKSLERDQKIEKKQHGVYNTVNSV